MNVISSWSGGKDSYLALYKAKKINITKTEKILKEGFYPHWFLDIKEYEILNK